MYKYKYVEVNLDLVGSSIKSNHHELIDQYAEEGWRLVSLVPISYNNDGKPLKFEIVFEKKIKD